MIYYNDPGRDIYFMRSRVAGCRMATSTVLMREYPEGCKTLEFESRFESGNLLKVDKMYVFYFYSLTVIVVCCYCNLHFIVQTLLRSTFFGKATLFST